MILIFDFFCKKKSKIKIISLQPLLFWRSFKILFHCSPTYISKISKKNAPLSFGLPVTFHKKASKKQSLNNSITSLNLKILKKKTANIRFY
jgi:hypothetical protein